MTDRRECDAVLLRSALWWPRGASRDSLIDSCERRGMPRSKFGPALKRLLAAGLIVIDDDGVYRVPQLVHDAVTVLEWTPSASQRAAAANGAHPER